MKIRRVFANNRKRAFVIESAAGVYDFPYSRLRLRPSRGDAVARVAADPELGREGFSYELESGRSDTVHMDAVLEYHRDPKYMCELLLHDLTLSALDLIRAKSIPKRELARRLKTSPRQLYRLLDPACYGKTINQMVRLLHVLGYSVEFVLKRAA
jgi:hypothetical protein